MYCDNYFTTYINQTIVLYTLNFHSDVYQSFLKKNWEKNKYTHTNPFWAMLICNRIEKRGIKQCPRSEAKAGWANYGIMEETTLAMARRVLWGTQDRDSRLGLGCSGSAAGA